MPGPENSKLSGCPVKTAHGQQWRRKGTAHALDSVRRRVSHVARTGVHGTHRRAWHARPCAKAGVAHVAHGCRWLSRHARKGMPRRPGSTHRDLPRLVARITPHIPRYTWQIAARIPVRSPCNVCAGCRALRAVAVRGVKF
ncbi:F-box/LRR-repeat protein 4 [Dorcoceras hygrometricum]|uniref:F-box/LRR-repeat protein 4 n=1 Tax=Dorcoceras hygrometricum TaxID=472368 RepID=A0A2Z7ACU7_9LAMI|nr:F-box/LRR-repeat protein 4 [Dorcoceras hygrometricum]